MRDRKRGREEESLCACRHDVPQSKCVGYGTVYDSLPPSFKPWLSNSAQQALQQCFSSLSYLVDSNTSVFNILKLILSDGRKVYGFYYIERAFTN